MNRHDLLLRIRALVFRRRVERDLEDELAFHIEMQTQKNAAAGMTPAEAARQARIQFGGAAQVGEECRDARGIGLIESTWQDIRYALRGFRRSPALVLTVVATIALGLGLDTAVFTIFNATYFRPIGVHEPGRLYELHWTDRAGASHDFSWNEYRELLNANPAFSAAVGCLPTDTRWEGQEVHGTLVTGEYFRVLGVSAARGRTLLPEDAAAPGRQPVVVLSYQSWQNRFSADPEIVGKKLLLRGYPFEIVGVAAPGFAGLGGRPSEFWAPVTMAARFEAANDPFGPAQPRSLTVVGRLKPEFRARQAEAGLTLWTQQLTANAPAEAKAMRATLLSRATTKPMNLRTALAFSPILAAFSLVLVIGCVNVANLLLARSMARRREIGIRLSLGAARGRLIRQLLTESMLLAVPSAMGGIVASEAIIRICLRVLLATLPPGVAGFAARIPVLHSDLRVFAFALAGALVSAMVFGLAPALQATRLEILDAAKGSLAGSLHPSRFRGMLLVGQVATCVLLLVTAGMLLGGAGRVHNLDNQLSTRNTIQLSVEEKSREAVLGRLFAEPSIESIAAARCAPVERKPAVSVRASSGVSIPNAAANYVSPEYFALFQIPMVRGRNFTDAETRPQAPTVAVLSQTAAQRLWPNQEAVGRTLEVQGKPAVTVVGIARDEISRWIGSGEDKSLVYFPGSLHAAGSQLFAGVRGDLEAAQRRIEADLTAADPEAVRQIQKLQVREWVEEDAYYSFRVAYWLSSAIGVLALLLTLSGIYSVMSYVISRRTKEIGIRMAMGATTGAVTGLILKQSMRPALIGAAAGVALAMAMSRVLASVLVMIDTFDGAAYFGGTSLVLAACAAAAYFPSRRASRIDPLTTLRYD